MCAKRGCAVAKGLCFICGNVRRRASYRLRYRMLNAAIRRLQAGRAAPLRRRRAPIMDGVKRYGRRNAAGNIVLPPIIVSGPKPIYVAPTMRRPRFKKIFNKARASAIYSGSCNFSDLGILSLSFKMIMAIQRRLRPRRSILDRLHNRFLAANTIDYVCTEYEKIQLNYIKAFYIFLNTTTGKYVRRFQRRGFEWEDLNNAYDDWMKGWEFEFLDELWTRVWTAIPMQPGGNWYNNHGKNVPGRIPVRRIWRRNDYVTDESVRQIIKYLIEELIEPAYWNIAYAYVL